MLPERLHWIIEAFEPEGDPDILLQIARDLEAEGNLQGAAAVYDRAYGLEPDADRIRRPRAALLDRLVVREYGLVFRYVPGGPFVMGSGDGEDDETPLHPVWLTPYWLSETPMSWSDYCRLMDWPAPPEGGPPEESEQFWNWMCANQLCAHYSVQEEPILDDARPRRRRRRRAEQTTPRFDTKPMVGVGWHGACDLAARLSKGGVRYGLPTEAQWEKAARGGLIGARHAWGDEPPTADNCDFNRFRAFQIHPSKTFAPNGYGLYAMNGGVWEWTADWYYRDYYRHAPSHDPTGPAAGAEKVLRGGSWADCAEVVTVSFRMSRAAIDWRDSSASKDIAPNLGFRLCRQVVGQRWP
jgi:formylglycine-generating enzyme required for sulfatase activity